MAGCTLPNPPKRFSPPMHLAAVAPPEHASASISIEAAGETFDTDVRLSGPRVSPRKSFKTWLNAQHAVAGAKARLYQTGERTYKLEYLG
jgi:hypothetical protein